jgi:Double zinc ribbon
MDQDQRDPRDWQGPQRPDEEASDVAPGPPDDEVSDQAPGPPDHAEADADAAAVEPAPTEPDWTAAEPTAAEPTAADASAPEQAASEIESWPSNDAAHPVEEAPAAEPAPEAPSPEDSTPWPTEPPEAGEAEQGTWPTSAPERGEEVAAAAGTASAIPSEVEAETDESSWAAAGAGAAAGEAPASEPPPEEAEAYPAAAAATVAATGAAAQGVPDAEAATGESTMCPRCGTENRPGLAFCRNCGQRLVAAGVATTVERPGAPEGTMACPRCGTHNRTGVAFCQNCGANLRGTAPGYVPPAVAGAATAERAEAGRGTAVLGPVVLLIGVVGLITGYLLPFAYGDGSLYERAFGPDGYGFAFWTAYPSDSLADMLYFGFAAPVPILAGLLAILAVAGFVRASPGRLQVPGLVVALAWSVGLIVLFLVVEVIGNWGGDIVGMLRELSPGGIILFLASLIVLIGTLTRFGRS